MEISDSLEGVKIEPVSRAVTPLKTVEPTRGGGVNIHRHFVGAAIAVRMADQMGIDAAPSVVSDDIAIRIHYLGM